MSVINISAAVGVSATNRYEDVINIQVMLNHFIGNGKLHGYSPLTLDGKCGPKTREAIMALQFQNGLISDEHFNGQVRPHGKTITFMNKYAGHVPIFPAGPATGTEVKAEGNVRDFPYDLYVLQRKNDDGKQSFPNAAAKIWHGDEYWQEIDTIDDLVRLAKRRCGARGYLQRLRIGGHGTMVSFRIGSTSISRSNLDGYKHWLSPLATYFRPGRSVVILDHCGVGYDTALLKQVAKVFGGIAVVAPLGDQDFNEGEPALEGPANICGPGGCVRIASPNMQSSYLLEFLYRYGDMHPDEKERLKKFGIDVE